MDMELTGSFPIIIDGKESGRMDVNREGLFWCFEATSTMSDGIIRLSAFGEDGEGYLGVMEPSGEGLRLKKKLSRAALKGFPRKITHGGKQGQSQAAAVAEAGIEDVRPQMPPFISETTAAAPGSESSCQSCEADDNDSSQINQRPPPERSAPESKALIWRMCGCPASYLSTIEGKNIFGGQSNVLEANDGEYIYLALPEEGANLQPEQQKLFRGSAVIMGTPYLICKTKSGVII